MAVDLDTVGMPDFDPADPGGAYALDLLKPYDRAVANELLRLVRASGGYDEWKDVHVNQKLFEPQAPFSMSDALLNEVMFPTVVDIFGVPGGELARCHTYSSSATSTSRDQLSIAKWHLISHFQG